MKNSKCYFVLVVADEEQNGKIIGTATLILEQKFIRQCALKGRVEEVNSFLLKKFNKTIKFEDDSNFVKFLKSENETENSQQKWVKH